MSNILKCMLLGWAVNLIVFMSSLFLYHYCVEVDHWSKGAWEVICGGSAFTKFVLSCLIIVSISDNGIDGLKKERNKL